MLLHDHQQHLTNTHLAINLKMMLALHLKMYMTTNLMSQSSNALRQPLFPIQNSRKEEIVYSNERVADAMENVSLQLKQKKEHTFDDKEN